jgi:formylglycine-generating enzyme required for sulfatase activity
MGNDPSSFKGDRNPVEQVSWKDAKAFLERLSAKTGKAYRLPSESEWEYAARGDTQTPFHFGLMISPEHANYNGNYTYSGGPTGVFRERTIPVGRFPANAFGLHDVAGNVMEWVEDCYHDRYAGVTTDGRAWTTGADCSERVLRGGSWDNRPWDLRSAARIRYHIAYRSNVIGFRVARTLP